MKRDIEIIGARENNLQNIDVIIPREKFTVVTGVSGSGKSSLVFDTLFGEGHRRFLESLTAWARTRLPSMKKPDVNMILGLSPVVSIQQRKGISNPRSTVASLTDIGSYLRLLYSIAGTAHCPYCGDEIPIKSSNQIADKILHLPKNTTIEIRAVVSKVYDEDYRYVLDNVRNQGYRNVRIDGEIVDTSQEIELDEEKDYRIEAIIDKFVINGDLYKQIVESLEAAFYVGQKFITIEILNPENLEGKVDQFYEDLTCLKHYTVTGELLPWYFTANDPESACSTCTGIGTYMRAEKQLLIEDENLSLREGALDRSFFNMDNRTFKKFNNPTYMYAYSLAEHYGFSLDTPFKDLPEKIKDILFHGSKGEKIEIKQPPDHFVTEFRYTGQKIPYSGLLNRVNRMYKDYWSKKDDPGSVENRHKKRLMVEHICPDCEGVKLKKSRLLIEVNGKSIHETSIMTFKRLSEFLEEVEIPEEKADLGNPVLRELKKRVDLMLEIGLYYLSLHRRSDTLSGGEMQRTVLSTQIGSELMGMMYILDEPSIGLHQKDGHKLIKVLKKLRDLGNTVIVVEHDTETMIAADHLIELGPGPGIHGGKITFQGKVEEIKNNSKSLTGLYLTKKKQIEIPEKRREINGQYLTIYGAKENNLQNLDVKIPLGMFTCITGVSGSGKSSLISEILHKKLHYLLKDKRIIPGIHERIEGYETVKDIRNIDQSPIGRTSRSNPATFVGFYDKIRELFTEIPESKARGYELKQFSFNNNQGGRCLHCRGWGLIRTELQFMHDVVSVCPECNGARFNKETLEIQYRGKNIAEVLDMTVEEGLEFFKDNNLINHKLKTMNELGLGYLKLGQSSTTLSGGEAQRIKLSRELGKIKRLKDNLYILDEPTTGLHLDDIKKLLLCINRLVDEGNTIIVIEHNLDVIKTADYVIDLGPEGGEDGGFIVAEGTPEAVSQVAESYTGQYLKAVLNSS